MKIKLFWVLKPLMQWTFTEVSGRLVSPISSKYMPYETLVLKRFMFCSKTAGTSAEKAISQHGIFN